MKNQISKSMTSISFGDSIDSLPTDDAHPSDTEIKIVETLFKEQHTSFQKFLGGSKEYVILLILFIILALPLLDPTISKYVNTSETPYLLVFLKGIIFVVVFFIISNMHLVRAKN